MSIRTCKFVLHSDYENAGCGELVRLILISPKMKTINTSGLTPCRTRPADFDKPENENDKYTDRNFSRCKMLI